MNNQYQITTDHEHTYYFQTDRNGIGLEIGKVYDTFRFSNCSESETKILTMILCNLNIKSGSLYITEHEPLYITEHEPLFISASEFE